MSETSYKKCMDKFEIVGEMVVEMENKKKYMEERYRRVVKEMEEVREKN